MNWKLKLPLNKNPKYTGVLFLIFIIIGFLASVPCMCYEGAVRASFINTMFILILGRLLFDILRGKLRYSTLRIYWGIFILFCILVESV